MISLGKWVSETNFMATDAQVTANRENAKKGGRPAGSKSQTTIDREQILKAWRGRAAGKADYLLDRQLHIAGGQAFLFRIDKEKIGPKRYRKLKPVLVTDVNEIHEYIERLTSGEDMDHDSNSGDDESSDGESSYYYITIKEPNNLAIDSILDRTFGRAKQGDLDINHKTPVPIRPMPASMKPKLEKKLKKPKQKP